MLFTTRVSTSVPTWGFASYVTERGAPWLANSRRTCAIRLSCVPVLSFPSENVPAPPSPNWTLHSVSSAPPLLKAATLAVRASASRPRSRTMGRSPARASVRAQNIPAGPKPAMTGGAPRGVTLGILYVSSGSAGSPFARTATVQTYFAAPFRLASRLRRLIVSSSMSPGRMSSFLAASL